MESLIVAVLFYALIVGSFVSVVVFISWVNENHTNSKKYIALKPKLDNLENSIRIHNENVKREREDINEMVKQKSMCFPWLANAFAEYYQLMRV